MRIQLTGSRTRRHHSSRHRRQPFNAAFRANSFVAVGLTPIYHYISQISFRLSSYCFLPARKIAEGENGEAKYAKGWLNHPQYFVEFDVCYKLPFATIAAYGNYASSPARNWNCGIPFGVFLPAPRYLR